MYIYLGINFYTCMHPEIFREAGLLVNTWGVNFNCKLVLTTNFKKSLFVSYYTTSSNM